MKLIVATYRSAGTPELVEAVAPDGTYAALIDRDPTLDSHMRAAEALMLKMGYLRRDYSLLDGTASTDRHWTFTLVVRDDFTEPRTR